MFKQFKKRQLISNISILSILLLIIFSSLYISTYRDITQRNNDEITRLITSTKPDNPNPPLLQLPGYSLSFVIVVKDNEVIETISGLGVTENLINDAFDLVTEEEGTFELNGYNFQYHSESKNGIIIYGFLDITKDQEVLSSLFITYVFIFLGSILVTFLITYFMTSSTLKPVEESYIKQKEFIANASHELKTPLTVINTNVDVLLSSKEFMNNKWLEYIKGETNRMNKLTNDLLFLAKTSEIQQVEKEQFNASKELKSLLLGFEVFAYEKNIKLSHDIEDNVDIEFNKTQFSQISSILLDNAIKYTPLQEEIIVTLKRFNNSIMLSIKNTGITLSESEKKNIFDRFYMTDASRGSQKHSYGLGLSIAKEIAKINNSDLSVKSEEGTYTEFVLKIN